MYSVENPQDKQGLFNITGSPPSEGLVAVRDLNDHWGYMNKSGQMVIKPNFRSASSFHDGVALVVPER
jgi:hypothetical protein